MSDIPTARSLPEHIGDVLISVWPAAKRLESNARNVQMLYEEAGAEDAAITFLVQFVGFLQKKRLESDNGEIVRRPRGEPWDQHTFAVTVRFGVDDDVNALSADGYERIRRGVAALRAESLVRVDGELFDIEIHGAQSLQDAEITADVFEIAITAE